MFRSPFKTPQEGLTIELRPKCGKCKKEFMLYLKHYLPGKFHSCVACGNVIQFDQAVAEKVKILTEELETVIQEAIKDLQKLQ
jgi:hypothetical protein